MPVNYESTGISQIFVLSSHKRLWEWKGQLTQNQHREVSQNIFFPPIIFFQGSSKFCCQTKYRQLSGRNTTKGLS